MRSTHSSVLKELTAEEGRAASGQAVSTEQAHRPMSEHVVLSAHNPDLTASGKSSWWRCPLYVLTELNYLQRPRSAIKGLEQRGLLMLRPLDTITVLPVSLRGVLPPGSVR